MNDFLRTLTIALAGCAGVAMVVAGDPPPQPGQDVAKRVDRILAAYEKYGMFDGAVLLATRGEIVFKHAYGMANRDWDIPNSTDTKFSIASLGKAMTAHLVLKLADQGRLALDERIGAYLPNFGKGIGEKVTVHHLLTHSSGLSWWATGQPGYQLRSYSLKELVKRAKGLELQFEPGSRTLYSNSGYNLLAAIIERVTGEKFEDAMRKRILEPAGMRDTGFAWVDQVAARRATGYDRLPGGEYVPALPNLQYYAIGAGGMCSTVEDMLRWNRFLDRDLSTRSRERMFEPHFQGTGYGWNISRYTKNGGGGGKYAVGTGGTSGFASVQGRCLDDDHYMIILSNVRQLDQNRIANDLVNTILGFDVTPPTRSQYDAFFVEVIKGGSEASLERYRRRIDGDSELPDQRAVNAAGYAFLEHRRFDEAITLFRFNVAAYPRAWNPYDSLSEAYELAGLEQLAVENARASLRLNPNNEAAARRIERLKR